MREMGISQLGTLEKLLNEIEKLKRENKKTEGENFFLSNIFDQYNVTKRSTTSNVQNGSSTTPIINNQSEIQANRGNKLEDSLPLSEDEQYIIELQLKFRHPII